MWLSPGWKERENKGGTDKVVISSKLHSLLLFSNSRYHSWIPIKPWLISWVLFLIESCWIHPPLYAAVRISLLPAPTQTEQQNLHNLGPPVRLYSFNIERRGNRAVACSKNDTYIHELHVGFGACGLVEDFYSNGNLHRLAFWDPDALKVYKHWLWMYNQEGSYAQKHTAMTLTQTLRACFASMWR